MTYYLDTVRAEARQGVCCAKDETVLLSPNADQIRPDAGRAVKRIVAPDIADRVMLREHHIHGRRNAIRHRYRRTKVNMMVSSARGRKLVGPTACFMVDGTTTGVIRRDLFYHPSARRSCTVVSNKISPAKTLGNGEVEAGHALIRLGSKDEGDHLKAEHGHRHQRRLLARRRHQAAGFRLAGPPQQGQAGFYCSAWAGECWRKNCARQQEGFRLI